MRNSIKALLTATVAVMIGAGAMTGPAEASVSQGWVAATTNWLGDDWDDEGEVSRNSHAYSGATGLWQAVLWADGAIESNGTRYDAEDIDCEFGPNTEAATRSWQRTTGGLSVDGQAGPRTWTAAGDHLVLDGWYEDAAIVKYVGRYGGRSFRVYRFPLDGSSTAGAYFTVAWDWSYFTYDYKPSHCAGVPGVLAS
ncbi:peptidoglycan-binding domain-containing protein [Phytomonospora endophytica]|uniref:Peptidoglycan binding-like domain-containing protein n=1 Tax=Phytomonospora endophytica TaxID=714109 RepID=A0A841FP19_9ACTN|nr:peptidoglycan-binding domain-containing protein [Phytomonospora endophytica]MBB6037846.1 hypothetical protein [Phytomonospora endophytica]GIG68745.1 hypothetical protein Pen01_50400 [Phytomonospora endophytica]